MKRALPALVVLMCAVGLALVARGLGVAGAASGEASALVPRGVSGLPGVADKESLAMAARLVSAPTRNGIVVGRSYKNDTSLPLRDILPVIEPPARDDELVEHEEHYAPEKGNDPVVQRAFGALAMPTPIFTVEGTGFNISSPSDDNGEPGRTQYLQLVNRAIQVFDKASGASVFGPVSLRTLWSGFGGACEFQAIGDVVTLYDQLADRWLISNLAPPGPYWQCIAISQTPDATGPWHRYAFLISATDLNDYPKFGLWPDGYYASANMFGATYNGPQPFVFDRDQMLTGQPADYQTTAAPLGAGVRTLLPADMEGDVLPPAGAPNPYISSGGSLVPIYHFHVDWDNPNNSNWSLASILTAAPFTSFSGNVPQPVVTDTLQALADRGMFRSVYRRFEDGHEALVGNHTVASGGVAAVRWWEIAGATTSTPSYVQQGTYQPDSTYRWMGSAAIDKDGDIAVGYSASSTSIYPSVRYAGRLVTDPLGSLAQGEAVLWAGTGSQVGTGNRWGDYSDMTVDPVDGCTFWYTNMYYQTTGASSWHTRIGNFRFPSCVPDSPTPTATGTPPTPTRTSTPRPSGTPTVTGTPPTATPSPTLTPLPCSQSETFTGAITVDDPTQTGRLFRGGVVDQCGTLGSCSVFDSTPRHYDLYTFTNTASTTICVTVDISACTGNFLLYSAVYLDSFDPANICSNHLAGIGASPNPTGSYSFSVPAGRTFVINLHEVNADAGCASYTLMVSGLPGVCPTSTPTETFTPTGTATETATGTATATATATAMVTVCPVEYSDVPVGSTFYEFVRCLACQGIVSGYADGTFRPNNNVTRGQSAKIVANSAGFSDPQSVQTFEDVPVGSTFFAFVGRLASRGYVSGYPCGGVGEPCMPPGNRPYFRPNANVTRGQLSKIVSNAAGYSEPPGVQSFEDVEPGSAFYDFVQRLASRNVMGGYVCGGVGEPCVPPGDRPYFRPGSSATRGQASKIVANTFFPGCSP